MDNYTAVTEDGKFMAHYGIKGMKWGKKKSKSDYKIRVTRSKSSSGEFPNKSSSSSIRNAVKKSKQPVQNAQSSAPIKKTKTKYTTDLKMKKQKAKR